MCDVTAAICDVIDVNVFKLWSVHVLAVQWWQCVVCSNREQSVAGKRDSTRTIHGSMVLSGRLRTRKLKFTICRSPVPVTEEITRGLVRMSMICGVCTQGTIIQVPSSYTSSKIPLNLSNMTPRSPPSTAHHAARSSELASFLHKIDTSAKERVVAVRITAVQRRYFLGWWQAELDAGASRGTGSFERGCAHL